MNSASEISVTTVKKERISSFELLRILAIIFIIAHHLSVHGLFDFSGLGNSPIILLNHTWISFIAQLGKAGVNIFVLITGYFLIDGGLFKTKKVLYIVLEMLVFSLSIGIPFIFIYKKSITPELVMSLIFPFGGGKWWFVTSYLLLYILSPLINLGIRAMNKKMHLIIIAVLVTLWSVIPTFIGVNYDFSTLGWFLTLYLIASYIRLYDFNIKCKSWLGILISVLIFVFSFAAHVSIQYLFGNSNYFVSKIINWFSLVTTNNIFQVASVIILFLSFKKIQMKSIKSINLIASTTLAIYLLHDHNDMRQFIWNTLFKCNSYASSPLLIPFSIGVITCVFVAGALAGIAYRYSLGLLINYCLSRLEKKFFYKIDDCVNKQKEIVEEK